MKVLSSFALVAVAVASHLAVPVTRAQEQRGVNIGVPAAASRYHALVIGNNSYQQLPKLQTAENDAREVEKLLKENYGFRTRLLLNATRQQIVSALASYRRDLTTDDNLVVYYAGHGINDAEAGRAYWLPVDASRDDNSNWISADDITAGTKTIPARHVLVISDSCYSGTLTRGIGEMLPRPTEREQFLRKMMAGRSRTLMASGGNEPVADGGGGGHSVFAGALLRGLRAMDKDQFTAAELFRNFIEESVSGRANQTPEYNPLRNSGHESGDFIFVRLKVGGKNVEVTVKTPPTAAAIDPAAFELSYWNSIQNSTDPEDFKDYLMKYPNGQFATIARRRAGKVSVSAPVSGNDEFVGTYRMAAPANLDLTITKEPDGLFLQATGQPKVRLALLSDSQFKLLHPQVEAQITFIKDTRGRVSQLALDQHGQHLIANKILTDPTTSVPDTSSGERAEKNTHPLAGSEAWVIGGLILIVELTTPLDTSTAQTGDRIMARVVAPSQYEGATVEGHISNVRRGGRVTPDSEVGLLFDSIRSADGRTYKLSATVLEVERENVTGKDVRVKKDTPEQKATDKSGGKIGSGVGALIGAIAGGGKGAAIGAGSGDTESVVISPDKDFRLGQGARLKIQTLKPLND